MRFFLFSLLGIGLVLAEGKLSGPVWAATEDANVVITECQKRTGLSEAGCISLIKKYMSVERCQSYTDLTAQECEEKITELKTDPKFNEQKDVTSSPPSDPKDLPSETLSPKTLPPKIMTLPIRIHEAKREKEQRFTLIQNETKAIIDFLKQQGHDMRSLEAELAAFEQKKQTALLAYDVYQSMAAALSINTPDELLTQRQEVLRTLQASAEHYRTAVLAELRQAVAQAQ